MFSLSRQKSTQGTSASTPSLPRRSAEASAAAAAAAGVQAAALPAAPGDGTPAVPAVNPKSRDSSVNQLPLAQTNQKWWTASLGKTTQSTNSNSNSDSNNNIANLEYSINSGVSDTAAWRELRGRVLPLFNGEGLKGSIEELNDCVIDWLNESASRSGNIRSDLNELVTSGTVILGKKMLIAGEETLIPRLLDLWSFFFATVVPYVQGVFVPIQERVKGMEGPSASIDIRAMTLIAFRDKILIPLAVRMEALLPRLFSDIPEKRFVDIASRCVQMFSVLQSVRSKPNDEMAKKCQQLLALMRDCIRAHEESAAKSAKSQQKEQQQKEQLQQLNFGR